MQGQCDQTSSVFSAQASRVTAKANSMMLGARASHAHPSTGRATLSLRRQKSKQSSCCKKAGRLILSRQCTGTWTEARVHLSHVGARADKVHETGETFGTTSAIVNSPHPEKKYIYINRSNFSISRAHTRRVLQEHQPSSCRYKSYKLQCGSGSLF